MPKRPVITVSGPNSVAITASTFDTSGEAVRHARQVGVEDAGDPVLEHDRVVREAHELIVDVAKPVGHLLVDDR